MGLPTGCGHDPILKPLTSQSVNIYQVPAEPLGFDLAGGVSSWTPAKWKLAVHGRTCEGTVVAGGPYALSRGDHVVWDVLGLGVRRLAFL